MIMTFGSAMDLLLSIGALILTIGIMVPTLRIYRRWKKCDEEEKCELEKSYYLVFSAVIIILSIRLFLIPLYFWTLQGFVPMIPGAMCLWGVFEAYPGTTWGSLPLKFILPVAYIGWLLLAYLNGKSKTHPLMQNLTSFFLFISPLVIIDSVSDIITFSQLTPTTVSCCSDAIDVGTRPVAGMIAGVSGQTFLIVIFFLFSAVFGLFLYLAIRHRASLWISMILSIPLAGVLVLTITEVLTPWLLKIPFHHCPFCLFFEHPLSIIFIILFWFALSAPWLVFITDKLGTENDESKETEKHLREILLTYASIAMAFSLIIIAVDIMFTFV